MKHFRSGTVDIAFLDEGAGHPILLIHGFASSARVNWVETSWLATLTRSGRRVIALDTRGHGGSGKLYSVDDYRIPLMAGDSRNLLDHLGIARADVMGYSMGGRIAAFLAATAPDRVRSLIVGGIGMAMVHGMAGGEEIAAALTAPDLAAAPHGMARGYRTFAERTGSDLRALAACVLGSRDAVPAAMLARIKAPTLVAVGEEDEVAGSGAELAKIIPGAVFLPIPRRDHMLATGDRVFKEAVVAFLAKRP